MRRIIAIISIVPLLIVVSPWATADDGQPRNRAVEIKRNEQTTLLLTVRAPQTAELGQPIVVHVTLQNRSERRVSVATRGQHLFIVQLYTDDGEDVSLTPEGQAQIGTEHTGGQIVYLEPGDELTRDFDLTECFRIEAPGEYRVWAHRVVYGRGTDTVLVTGPHRLQVLPPQADPEGDGNGIVID